MTKRLLLSSQNLQRNFHLLKSLTLTCDAARESPDSCCRVDCKAIDLVEAEGDFGKRDGRQVRD